MFIVKTTILGLEMVLRVRAYTVLAEDARSVPSSCVCKDVCGDFVHGNTGTNILLWSSWALQSMYLSLNMHDEKEWDKETKHVWWIIEELNNFILSKVIYNSVIYVGYIHIYACIYIHTHHIYVYYTYTHIKQGYVSWVFNVPHKCHRLSNRSPSTRHEKHLCLLLFRVG